jgi:hypothetical protein
MSMHCVMLRLLLLESNAFFEVSQEPLGSKEFGTCAWIALARRE